MTEVQTTKKLINTKELLTMLSFGRTKLNELVANNKFPQPIRFSQNFIRWDLDEVNGWIEEKKATRGNND